MTRYTYINDTSGGPPSTTWIVFESLDNLASFITISLKMYDALVFSIVEAFKVITGSVMASLPIPVPKQPPSDLPDWLERMGTI